MNCLFFSSISNPKFNAEEVIASSLLKTVRNRLDMCLLGNCATLNKSFIFQGKI